MGSGEILMRSGVKWMADGGILVVVVNELWVGVGERLCVM